MVARPPVQEAQRARAVSIGKVEALLPKAAVAERRRMPTLIAERGKLQKALGARPAA
jgi:hypothetical protein